jgi:nucleoid-associated protein YgaU
MREQSTYSYESSTPPEPAQVDVEEEATHTRILWARIAALAIALLLAFGAGFLLAPRESSDNRVGTLEAELAQSQQNSEELQAQLAESQTQLDAAEARVERLQAQSAAEPQATESPAPSDEIKIKTYTVQPGDTLQGIAVDFYGDVDYDDFLADYNGIADTTELPVGFDLEIPPKPETP